MLYVKKIFISLIQTSINGFVWRHTLNTVKICQSHGIDFMVSILLCSGELNISIVNKCTGVNFSNFCRFLFFSFVYLS